MSNLHLIRHGFSLANFENYTGGDIGFSLTDEYTPLEKNFGVKQAEEAGIYLKEKLKGKKVLFFVSPYYRTRETLYHILKEQYPDTDITIIIDKNLREINQGLQFQSSKTGEYTDEVKYQKELQQAYADKGFYRAYIPFLQGESIIEVGRRVRSFEKRLTDINNTGKYDDIVVVSHNAIIKLIYMWYTKKDMGKVLSGSVISINGDQETRFEPKTYAPKDYVSDVSYDNYLKLLSFQKEIDSNKSRYSKIFGDRKLSMPLQEECVFIEKDGETLIILPGNNEKKGIFFIDTTFGQDNITYDKKSTSTYHVVSGKGIFYFKGIDDEQYNTKEVSLENNTIIIPSNTVFYYESDPEDPLKLIEVMEPNYKEDNVVVIEPTTLDKKSKNIK